MNIRNDKGFSLIELMIVIAIVAVLASIAMPAYQDQMDGGRRADGKAALMAFAQAMERSFTEEGTYAKADGDDADETAATSPTIFATQAPISGATKSYNLQIMSADSTNYVLRATPINAQADDGALEITSTGIMRWDRDDDGFGSSDNCWERSC
jgi:type IV pilus assembly protein PilE